MGFMARGVEAGACVATVALLVGLAAVAWLPDEVHVWDSFPIPRMMAILIIPLIAFLLSLFLCLIISCDPRVASHSRSSGAAMAGVIALPGLLAIPVEVLVIVAATSKDGHHVGTVPVVLLACMLDFALSAVFRFVEPNYVVGIRDLWTLQSSHVWQETHFLASYAFAVAGVLGLVLVFFVPQGLWQLLLVAGLFVFPTALSILYSYVIREDAQYIVR